MTKAEAIQRLQDICEGRWSTWVGEHGVERAAMCDAMEAVKLAALVAALTCEERT